MHPLEPLVSSAQEPEDLAGENLRLSRLSQVTGRAQSVSSLRDQVERCRRLE